MFKYLLINFSLIFAFTILVFLPYQHSLNNRYNLFQNRISRSIFVGILFGLIGNLLAYLTLDVLTGIFYNSKIIFVLFSGLLGGPIAILISGFIMVFGRMFLFSFTEFTVIMTLNFSLQLIVIYYYSKIYRLRYENISRYLYFTIIQTNAILLFMFDFSFKGILYIVTFTIFTIITFWSIYFVLSQSQNSSDQARQMMAIHQIDYLTKLPNNYAIHAKLESVFSQYNTFSILIMNIDQFKKFNEQYSYLIGDHILEEFAQLLQQHTKDTNGFVGRMGGEEFCYVIPELPPAIALYEAEKLRTLIENHVFGTSDGVSLKISISIGISSTPDNGVTIEELFSKANTALQASKKQRNNQVYHFNQYVKDIEGTRL